VSQAKTITTARILDGALTSLRAGSGTATFIVAEQTTVIARTGAPTITQYRLEGQLTRTPSGWKLSSLHVVPTGVAAPDTGSGPGPGPGG
jgi:Mce-associated membrane protein